MANHGLGMGGPVADTPHRTVTGDEIEPRAFSRDSPRASKARSRPVSASNSSPTGNAQKDLGLQGLAEVRADDVATTLSSCHTA
jgi:hypothetical protein